MSDASSSKKQHRAKAAAFVPIAIGLAWLGFWLWQAGSVDTPPMPPIEDQRALLALAREAVLAPGVAPRVPETKPRHDLRGAIVTIYLPGTVQPPVASWAEIEDGDAGPAVARAAAEAGRKWEAAKRPGQGSERVRIDLTGRERPVFAADRRPGGRTRLPVRLIWRLVPTIEDVMDPGIDGLVLRDGEKVWFAGPSDRVERGRDALQTAQAVRTEAKSAQRLRRFRAASFIEPPAAGAEPLTIVRGNVLPPYPATAELLRDASLRGGLYLARMVDANGRFNYQFDAASGRNEGGYNLLRHAGTLWSMFQIYGDSGDPVVRAAAERGLAYMGREFVWTDPRVPGAMFLREGPEFGRPLLGDVKLGACGLGILAYTEAEKQGVALSDADKAIMVGLGKGILAMQKPDGELSSYYPAPGVKLNPRRSVYYPGEAILGLMELYARDQDPVWLDAAKRAADFQIQRRWRTAGIEVQVPPDAWLTQALEKLWLATKEPRYKRYAYRLGNELVAQNHPVHGRSPVDLRGAFAMERVVRVTPTSSRNEAVVAAARLARVAGDESYEKKFFEAARAAAWFGVAQQFRPENMHFVVKPELAEGGIRETITNNSVRIDGVQHAVSGFLGLAEMIDERAGGERGAGSRGEAEGRPSAIDPKPMVTGTAGGPS